MTKLPIDFTSAAKVSPEFEKAWEISSGSNLASCAIPTEFGGLGGAFSPEDLFLQSLINCFIGTFKVIARASKINFSLLEVKGRLTVDKNEGKVMMKNASLEIEISGADRPDRIENIVAKTFKDGFILNSVKTEITYSLRLLS